MLTKRLSVERYAEYFDITEEELNKSLKELGYQTRNISPKNSGWEWILTPKGRRHGRMSCNPFRRVILWDFHAYIAARSLMGKKARKYMYCARCQTYLNHQQGFSFEHAKWKCVKCGYVNDTV